MEALQGKISDAASFISLMLVFATVLFDIRYTQIQDDLRVPAPPGQIAKQRLKDRLIRSLYWKSLPLVIVNAFIFYLFLPFLLQIVKVTRFNPWNFDFILTAFIFVALMELVFTIWAALLSIRLWQRARQIQVLMEQEGSQ